MLDSILFILHHTTTLLFGVFLSAAFLGIHMNLKNILILFGFSSFVGVFYALSAIFFGQDVATQVYPLIVHMPLIIFLSLFYKFSMMLSSLSVLTAYLCCQISKWIGLVAFNLTHLDNVYYGVRIVVTIITFIILIRFVSDATAQLVQMSSRLLIIFTLLPFTYYLFDYVTGVYTSLIYSGKEVIAEFLGFVLCIIYLLFLLIYFKQYEEKRETEQKKRMLEMQRFQTQKEIQTIKRSEYAVSLLRHDLRHFLANIAALIDNNEIAKAKGYINEVIQSVDETAVHKYCKNEIVNMILSSYENELREHNIELQNCIRIPEKLRVPNVDLTSILSNALENAIHAVLPLEIEKRKIVLDIRMDDEKLLMSIKNPIAEKPRMIDGIPYSGQEGHGFGTQSICYTTDKLNGNWQFSVKEDWFILKIVL